MQPSKAIQFHKSSIRSLSNLHHAVSDTDFCYNIFWFARVHFEFSSNICHVDAERLYLARMCFIRERAPYFLNDKIMSKHFPNIPGKKNDDFILNRCEMNFFSYEQYEPFAVVNFKFSCRDFPGAGTVCIHDSLTMTKFRSDPRKQFRRTK